MDAGTWWLQQEAQKVESRCAMQKAQVLQAKTLAEVVRAADVIVPGHLRGLTRSMPGIRALEYAAETRIRAIIHERMMAIREAPSAASARQLRVQLLKQCEALRGDFGREYKNAERESQRFVFLHEQAEKDAKAKLADNS